MFGRRSSDGESFQEASDAQTDHSPRPANSTRHGTTSTPEGAWTIATEVATILMGVALSEYTPHVDTGDCVIITNAEQVVLTGRKAQQKTMQRFSGYPGAEGRVRIPDGTASRAGRREGDRMLKGVSEADGQEAASTSVTSIPTRPSSSSPWKSN